MLYRIKSSVCVGVQRNQKKKKKKKNFFYSCDLRGNFWWEVGAGGAPEEGSERIELLVNNHQEGARRLTEFGYNGDVLNLEPQKVMERVIPKGDKAKLKAIIKIR